MSDIRKGCCFSIEGSWGIGKTFVIENIEEKLEEIQLEKTNDDRYFVFHYNCWQHDYYEEPAVAIISAMMASINEDEALINEDVDNWVKAGYEFANKKFKEIAGLYIKNKIGINLISLADDINSKKREAEVTEWEFDKMFNFSQTIEKVRKKLQEIAEERTIVLFVDELDRCIPQYAIKVLERLHHIFYGLKNIVVVLAIDRGQLEHSVEEMFGMKKDDSSMDVEKYLKKFIDFSMVLDHGVVNESYWEKYKEYFDKFKVISDYDKEEVSNILPKIFMDIDIRRQEKIIEKANMVHSLVCNETPHISVLVFEIIYEVLQMYGFKHMDCLPIIDELKDEAITDVCSLKKEKLDLLRYMEEKAWKDRTTTYKKIILLNIYGKVFWYFAYIFIPGEKRFYGVRNKVYLKELDPESEIARKYHEFYKLIR